MSVVIETTIGDITVDLFTELRPIACLNFIKLCKLKYYNYNLFHTVEQNFIAQTGDPSGAGNGGCSIWGVIEGPQKRFFEAENLPKINHTSPGLLSLVSPGKNMVGSQFFFTLDSNLTFLDGVHCVIGEVVEGFDILRTLNETIVDENCRPFQDIRITHTVILNDPFDDPRGFQVPSRSPSPNEERLRNGRIAADEDIYDTDGKTVEELQEMVADREAKARATILEIVGDIPDADVAPPENVLFVCKLNPVTTDDDLEIIFSRFGRVKTCEVIRDKKTGDSLQYAFVEFEEQKSCEAAYFKMDNVLIDDRRIHVDFSQSVAKVKWRGKGRGVDGAQGRFDFNDLSEKKNKPKQENRPDERRNTYKDRRRSPKQRQYTQQNDRPSHRSRSRERRNVPDRKRYDDGNERYARSDKYNRKSPAYIEDSKYREERRQSQSPARKHRSNSKNRNYSRDTRSRHSRSPARMQKAYSRDREYHHKRKIEKSDSDRNYRTNHSPLRGRRNEQKDSERNRFQQNRRSPTRSYRDERSQDRGMSDSHSPRRDRLDSKACERKNGKNNDLNKAHRSKNDSMQYESSVTHSRRDSNIRNHKPLNENRSRRDQSAERSIRTSHDKKVERKINDKKRSKKSKYSSSSETESDSSTSDSSTTSSSSSSSSSAEERKRERNRDKKSRKTNKK